MNDDFTDLESRLKALRPVAPSAETMRNLHADLQNHRSPASAPKRRPLIWQLAGLGLAAALMLALGLSWRQQSPASGSHVTSVVSSPPSVNSKDLSSLPAEGTPADSNPQTAGVVPLYKPLRAKNTLHSVSDEGLFMPASGRPMRQYRYEFVDTVTWVNPADGSEIQVSVPRTELVNVPVQTM